MRILGISCYFHDSAAVLIEDGLLIAAAEEERFTRKKHDFEFPYNAIRYCLSEQNLTGTDLDYVVFFEKPFNKFDRLMKTSLQGFPKTYRMFVQSMKTWLLDKLWIKSLIAKELNIDSKRIMFSEHHLSHSASSYFCSPFEESAILTFDGVGEWSTTTMGTGKGTNISTTHEIRFPHSIGLLYSAFTAFLGFEVNEGEYKVMGMAPYGTPKYLDKIWKIVKQDGNGSFWIDQKYFAFHYSTNRSYTDAFIGLFGDPRDPEVPFFTKTSDYPIYYGERPRNFEEMCEYNQYYADIASSIQQVTEDLILSMAKELHRETGLTKLCLAGGVALNSVANARILQETPFEEIYIQPSAGDGGGALGAALVAWHGMLSNSKRFEMSHAYWGQSYNTEQCEQALEKYGLSGELLCDQQKLIDRTVEQLEIGKVIGWFQGRFEWGPRALGNRSILADPRSADMKDLVNTKIKFREPFRPFAPSVLADKSEEYFDLPCANKHMPTRFMLLVVPVKEEQQDSIPAVSHLGSARIQTVYNEDNPLYYKLIENFGYATGIPVLLNTSFNVRGEPIVNTPENAIDTFLDSGIDTLILGNHIINKPDS